DATLDNLAGRERLYGGTLSVPDDPCGGCTRRVYPFSRDNPAAPWKREQDSLFGPPDGSSWIGHNYGHQFIRDDSGTWWVFYERVDFGVAGRTEAFARRMRSDTQADMSQEFPIVSVGAPPYPSTIRGPDHLIEGPRPFRLDRRDGRVYYVVGYS